jgi:ABC-type multidrug transport system fused ATPase/permease subunit
LSILGETVCTAGHFVPPRTSIAYASQDPLIVSGTIRDNIVFGQVFVEQWYNVVLEACALEAEIDRMNAKDGTFLGEKGATLSGGQRQRIVSQDCECLYCDAEPSIQSLARAIYAKAPWTFLDDPFSSLDAETEKHGG